MSTKQTGGYQMETMAPNWSIYKIGADLEKVDLMHYYKCETAIMVLNRLGRQNNWNWVNDKSLFGGYWVSKSGDCYGVR